MSTMTLHETDLAFSAPALPSASRRRRWAGRVLTGLPVLFLAVDGVMKLVGPSVVVTATAKLGYPPSEILGIGAALLACLAVHLVPRTAILGAVLLTGFLGGAVATHVRVGDPVLSHVLFPTYVAAMLWAGLYLRDGRLRAVFARPVRA